MGVNTIYCCTGFAIFLRAFFRQKINFGVSFLVKEELDINFWVPFCKGNS